MKNGFVKVAAASPKISVSDCHYNKNQIISLIRKAREENVKILVLPELCVTGYTCGDLFFQDILIKKSTDAIGEIVRETTNIFVMVGAPLLYNNKLYNCSFVMCNGTLLGIVPKKHIPNYGEFYEKRHFEEAPEKNVYIEFFNKTVPFGTNLVFSCSEFPELKIACEICEDLWAVEQPSVKHVLAGATIIGNLSASNEIIGKADYRKKLVEGQSARLVAGYVYASAGDGESTQDAVYSAHNMIAENGVCLNESIWGEKELLISEIDVLSLNNDRRKNTQFVNNYTDEYEYIPFSMKQEVTKLTRYVEPLPFVGDDSYMQKDKFENVLRIQSEGLKKRIEHTFCKKIIVGISGGLDSALALMVMVRAIDALKRDRKDIIAVTMPCFGTTDRTKNNAETLSESLGVDLRYIDITRSVRQHFEDIGQDENTFDVTFENSQARERTQILMDIANKENGMVVGTGDLSELALGFATYNGDHMSMYGVNASVPKTLIRHLVKYEAEKINNPEARFALLDILNTPVSPELIPPKNGEIVQKTENLVGPYELHDFFLYNMLRHNFTPAKIYRLASYTFGSSYSNAEILKWLKVFYRRFFTQQFKRSCLPDGPKIGSVCLSPRSDFRMPSDASWKLWEKEIENLQ